MFRINTMSGDPVKTVVAKATIEYEFEVGGEDDDDRKDSVREAFWDHCREGFFEKAMTHITLHSVKVKEK